MSLIPTPRRGERVVISVGEDGSVAAHVYAGDVRVTSDAPPIASFDVEAVDLDWAIARVLAALRKAP